MKNSNKSVSANSKGIVISYGDSNKHMFVNYQTPQHVEQIQIYGSKRRTEDTIVLNSKQKDLFQKVVYGFSAYSKEEMANMSNAKKFKVKMTYAKAHRILNRWKQEIVNETVDTLFLTLFPKSSITKAMISEKGYDDSLDCVISFKELGVSKKSVLNKLIEFGLLPKNFFNLV